MDLLLQNDFPIHYGLSQIGISIILKSTNQSYFELNDDSNLIYLLEGQGIAKYKNANNLSINSINFESFINSLPPNFQHNREKCDLIVYDKECNYFLLNELTNSNSIYVGSFNNNKGLQIGKRAKAKAQMIQSLSDLSSVVSIKTKIETYQNKACCFFNKQSNSPVSISASVAFNKLNTISTSGFKMSEPNIESFGFEYWEFSGNQVFTL